MHVAKNTVVSIDYTLTGPGGQVLDSSKGREPLTYLQGAGNIIPGLERELEGKSPGDELKVNVPPEQGYGQRDEKLVQAVPKSAFEGVDKLEPGMQFRANTPGGQQRIVRVTKIESDQVTVDANHPLAGIPLTFEVKVVDVREPTGDEQQHGHAHGAGGVQH